MKSLRIGLIEALGVEKSGIKDVENLIVRINIPEIKLVQCLQVLEIPNLTGMIGYYSNANLEIDTQAYIKGINKFRDTLESKGLNYFQDLKGHMVACVVDEETGQILASDFDVKINQTNLQLQTCLRLEDYDDD